MQDNEPVKIRVQRPPRSAQWCERCGINVLAVGQGTRGRMIHAWVCPYRLAVLELAQPEEA